MLADWPAFPLVVDYSDENHDLTADDEQGIMLALRHRDRVRRVRLKALVSSLQKLITALDDQFPMLEYLHIGPPTKHDTRLALPWTFEAPNLRLAVLDHFVSPIGSPLLTTVVGLVVLMLRWARKSSYPHPNLLLQTLSRLPHLEKLELGYCSPVPKRDIERKLLHMPITTRVTLPNLHWFDFEGVSAYFEALLPYMTCPLMKTLCIRFFNQPSFSVPWLLQLMRTTEFFMFQSAKFVFYHGAVVGQCYSHQGARFPVFHVEVTCGHLDWQVYSVAQIFSVLSPLFSKVVDLTLDYREHTLSSEWHNQADRTWWRELLGSFMNVKTLRVHNGLVGEVSRSLQSDGEPALEILPELKELICPARSVDDKTFAPVIQEREVAGQPVDLIGETFPVGRSRYAFISSAGMAYIDPDPDPLP